MECNLHSTKGLHKSQKISQVATALQQKRYKKTEFLFIAELSIELG